MIWGDKMREINGSVNETDNVKTENKSSEAENNTEKNLDLEDDDFWKSVFEDEVDLCEDKENTEKNSLNLEEKQIIKKESGWSDEVVDHLRSMDEYEIYKKAGLIEGEVNGEKCLMRTDIDWDRVDKFNKTNRERISKGNSPLDSEGNPIELHHIGQQNDSPLAELTFNEHRSDGNDTVLHDKTKPTEVHGEGNAWGNQRTNYWKNRGCEEVNNE